MMEGKVHLNLRRRKDCIVDGCTFEGREHVVSQDASLQKDDAWYGGVSLCHYHFQDMMQRYVNNAHQLP